MENHGGNVYRFARQSGRNFEEIIDFSASINPLGPPKAVQAAIMAAIPYLCHYPDPEAYALTQALAKRLNIDPLQIICSNGSTELIHLLTRVLRPEAILLTAPTFLEYERAFWTVHRPSSPAEKIQRLFLLPEDSFMIRPQRFIAAMAEMATASCRMAFLCNPNNPTGGLLPRAQVLEIAAAAKELKCHLIVDEAFMDFVPESQSVLDEVKRNPWLTVLRSLTKIYAVPGLRIGFGVFPPPLAKVVRGQQEPWTVNTPAQQAAIAALADSDYLDETLAVIASGKKTLALGFERLGIDFFPPAANFFLIRHPRAQTILTSLRKKGIMLRDCISFPGLDGTYLRVAVRTDRENKLLIKELEGLCRAS